MASILFTWELGAGSGHILPIAALADELTRRGHEVSVAVRDLSRVGSFLGRLNGSLIQAPLKASTNIAFERPCTFAHILANTCFSSVGELSSLIRAWSTVYRHIRPELILFDHSPTALLAARETTALRVPMGTGYCVPPGETPFRIIEYVPMIDKERCRTDEEGVLSIVNESLRSLGREPLDRLGQLYGDVSSALLTTFPEMDHFPDRCDARYFGALARAHGIPPNWPNSRGCRVFAYLKPFPGMASLLHLLKDVGASAVIVGDGLDPSLKDRFAGSAINFESSLVNIDCAARECDVAVLNATHGTTMSMLLAGKPVLLLPLHLEQYITALRVEKMGAGVAVPSFDPQEMASALQSIINLSSYRRSAREFAARYSDWAPAAQASRAADMIEDRLQQESRR